MTAADSPPSLSTTTTSGAMATSTTAIDHQNKGDIIVLSNPSVSISKNDNFDVYPNFMTDDMTVNLLRDLGLLNAVTNGDIGVIGKEFVWEGFDQRRRVQRFRLPSPSAQLTPSTSSSSSGEKPTNEETSDESNILPPTLLKVWNRIHVVP